MPFRPLSGAGGLDGVSYLSSDGGQDLELQGYAIIGNLMKESIHGFHSLLAVGHLAGVFLLEGRFAAPMANLFKVRPKWWAIFLLSWWSFHRLALCHPAGGAAIALSSRIDPRAAQGLSPVDRRDLRTRR